MQKKWLIKCLMAFTVLLGIQPLAPTEASTPKVYWDGLLMVKGQVGKIKVIKPINLWKREGDKLIFERVLKVGEQYRVYRYDKLHGGQYGLGGGYYITKMEGYVEYKTPSKQKLAELAAIYAPSPIDTKLSIGKVTNQETIELAPGVTQDILSVDSNRGKQKIYAVKYDGKSDDISIDTALSNDQLFGIETVSSQANNQKEGQIIAGVNGDYFDENGHPIDLMMQNGNLVSTSKTPLDQLAVFGIKSDGKPIIGNPEVSISVQVNGENAYSINSVNRKRLANQLVLYTAQFASSTRTNELGTEVVVSVESGKLNGHSVLTGSVKKVIKSVGNETLNQNEIILSGHHLASQYLQNVQVGDRIEITTSFDSPEWNQVEEAISGRYHLVRNGSILSQTVAGVHPRTAIGITKDGGVIMVVADGRKPLTSVGLSLSEMASVMKDLGAVDAFTFDGGGSSTLVTKEPGETKATVVNNPSDGNERPVSNALLIIKRYLTDAEDPVEEVVNPTEPTILEDFEGNFTPFSASGARYNVAQAEKSSTAKVGTGAAKLNYDFTGTTGTSGIYLNAKTPIKVTGYPKKIGMWVYGDNNGHWLRMQLKDSRNQMVQLDFTRDLNWSGWKYVEATVPSGLAAPLYIETPVRYMEIEDSNKNSGTIYIDHIQALYE